MKNDYLPLVILSLLCIIVLIFIVSIQSNEITIQRREHTLDIVSLQNQAIQLGYAEFNRTNGNWQWITNR